MVERFNGRIAEVLATTRFDSSEHLTDTIKRYTLLISIFRFFIQPMSSKLFVSKERNSR